MILVKCDRSGNVTKLMESESYTKLVRHLERLSDEYEAKGIMLIKTQVVKGLARYDEFASKKRGWECVLIIADGWARGIKRR